MFELRMGTESNPYKIKPAKEMEPCEIAVVVDGEYAGHVVMRTATTVDKSEIMDLSSPGPGSCWTSYSSPFNVRNLPAGTEVILKVTD